MFLQGQNGKRWERCLTQLPTMPMKMPMGIFFAYVFLVLESKKPIDVESSSLDAMAAKIAMPTRVILLLWLAALPFCACQEGGQPEPFSLTSCLSSTMDHRRTSSLPVLSPPYIFLRLARSYEAGHCAGCESMHTTAGEGASETM